MRPRKGSQHIKAVISLTDLPGSDTFTFMLCDPAKSHFTVLIFLLPGNKDTKTNRRNFFRDKWKHMYIEPKCLAFEYIHLESFTHSPVYSLKKRYCRSWPGHCTRHWKQNEQSRHCFSPTEQWGLFTRAFREKDICSSESARTPMAYNCLEMLGRGDLGKVGGYIVFLGGPRRFEGGKETIFFFPIFSALVTGQGTMRGERVRAGCWTPGNVTIMI